jgi:hypothetical protein
MTQPDVDPRELLKSYYPLEGAVAPLAELLRVEPRLAEDVVALAMVMGIHAAERRAAYTAEINPWNPFGPSPRQTGIVTDITA